MAFTDFDHQRGDGAWYFENIPVAMLDDFGRIAVLSGTIEGIAYDFAHTLALRRPANGRTPNFRNECADIVSRLNDSWLPAHFLEAQGGSWRTDVIAWARLAPAVMDEHRNGLLHRAYYSRYTREMGSPVYTPIWNPDPREPFDMRELTAERLTAAISALQDLSVDGWRLIRAKPIPPREEPTYS